MNERLIKLIEYYGLNTYSFECKISVGEGTIRRTLTSKKGLNSETLNKISDNFPDINIDWLVTGRGQMLCSEIASSQPNTEPTADLTALALIKRNEELIQEIMLLRAEIERLKKATHTLVRETADVSI